jgi:hypothetical protein
MAFNYSPKIVTDGLVLALDAANPKSYPGSGTVWRDLSRGGNNGTLVNGPTYSSTNGGSIVFDGVNDYVDFGNILNFERTDSFTLNSWFKISSLGAFRSIITKMDSSFKGYALNVETTGQIRFILRNTPTTNSLNIITNSNLITVNNWFNLCATYNGSSITTGMTVYVNSIPYSFTVTDNTLTQSPTTSYPLNVAARTSTNNGYISGNIAQASIYNRALSAQEIQQNYNATKTRYGL